MGFMGISHWIESDNAADLRYSLMGLLYMSNPKQAVREMIDKELKDFANEHNTPGFLNIALCLEVEGKDGATDYEGTYDAGLPVFSSLMTLKQLRRVADLLDRTAREGWEPTRMRQLKRMVNKLIRQRRK